MFLHLLHSDALLFVISFFTTAYTVLKLLNVFRKFIYFINGIFIFLLHHSCHSKKTVRTTVTVQVLRTVNSLSSDITFIFLSNLYTAVIETPIFITCQNNLSPDHTLKQHSFSQSKNKTGAKDIEKNNLIYHYSFVKQLTKVV